MKNILLIPVARLVLGWLDPLLAGLFTTVRWTALLGICLWITSLSVMVVGLAVNNSACGLGKLLAITTFIVSIPLGIVVRNYWERRKEVSWINLDSKSGNLYYCTAEGDSYLAEPCGDGNYRLTFGGNGHFAAISETSTGYRIVTDEGDEYLVPRRYGALDYLPFALVACLALLVNTRICMAHIGNQLGEKLPIESYQIIGVLAPIFVQSFIKEVRLVAHRPISSSWILAVNGGILGIGLGWVVFHDIASVIIVTIVTSLIYVLAGLLLRKR